MFFRMPRFIRRYLRQRMHPMAEQKAIDIRQRLSIFYAIIAWNAAGYVMYQMFKGNKSWPITAGIRSKEEDMARPAMAWAQSLGVQNAEVMRLSSEGISSPQHFEVKIVNKKEKVGDNAVVNEEQLTS